MGVKTKVKKMSYIIEGTVLELTYSSGKYMLKICGAEGYSLRKKENDKLINVNVLFHYEKIAENGYVETNKETGNDLIIPESYEFNIPNDFALLCSSALASGKKLRFVFEEVQESKAKTDVITDVLDKKLKIVSLSLLAN